MTAECGNQQCELGEACSLGAADTAQVAAGGTTDTTTTSRCCPADCPLVVQSCAADAATGVACSGHGSCLSGVGVCRCFTGYTGDACDSCTAQYVLRTYSSNGVSSWQCVLLPGSLSTCVNGVRDGREVGVDCGGVCRPCNGTTAGGLLTTVPAGVGNGAILPVLDGVVIAAAATSLVAACVVAAVVRRRQRAGAQAIVVTGRPKTGGPSRGSRSSGHAGAGSGQRGVRFTAESRQTGSRGRASRGSGGGDGSGSMWARDGHGGGGDGESHTARTLGVVPECAAGGSSTVTRSEPQQRLGQALALPVAQGSGALNRANDGRDAPQSSRVVPWGPAASGAASTRLVKVQPVTAGAGSVKLPKSW